MFDFYHFVIIDDGKTIIPELNSILDGLLNNLEIPFKVITDPNNFTFRNINNSPSYAQVKVIYVILVIKCLKTYEA